MKKYMAFVFDDGPSFPMCDIVDRFKKHGYSAGFAVIGKKITDETAPMLKYAADSGFQLVSHGQMHLHMDRQDTREEMKEELLMPIKTVEQKIGYKITMARLPFLAESEEVLSVAKELGLPLLGQGIDGGRDWDSSTPAENIVSAVLGSVCDGAVVCLHVSENTCRALDTILPELVAQDYCLLTPQEMFKVFGITAPLGVQIHNIYDFRK